MEDTTTQQGPSVESAEGPDLDLGGLLLGAPGFYVAVIDSNNRVARANRGLEMLSGFSQQELHGKVLQALIQEPLADLLAQARIDGTPRELEAAFYPASGEPRRLRWNFLPLTQPQGWIVATGVEISQPERQQAVRQDQQRFLEKLLSTCSNFIYIYDIAEKSFTFSNRGLGEFMGFSSETPLVNGVSLFQTLLHPDDSGIVDAFFSRLESAADSEVHEVEYRLRHDSGDFHWVLNRVAPYSRGEDGRVREVLGVAQDITPRRTAEELHLRLVEIIESTPDVVATIRPDGTLVYLNWSGRELTGLRSGDLSGAGLRDITTSGEFERILKESLPTAVRDGYWAGDASIKAEDGEDVAVSLVIVAHPSSDSQVEYLSLIARDMRETRRMESKLRQGQDDLELRVAERTAELHRSEALYRTLAEAAPDIVFVLARDGRVEYLNSVAADQFKRTVDEMVGRFVTELFPPNVAMEQLNGVLSVFKTGKPYAAESKVLFPDAERWFNTILVPIRDEDGAVISVLGVSRDMTARRQIEDELFQSRQMLQLILDNIPQRVFWKNRDLFYLGANQPFLRDAGLESLEQVLGIDDFGLHWKASADVYRADDREVIGSGIPKLDYEESLITKDGEMEWLRTSKIPLRDREGQIFGVLGTYEDITGLKRAETLLAERNQELIRSNADLEQFAYIASHDLQEPLRMVASFAQLFARRYQGTLDERGEKYLTYIVDGAYRMQQLIDDLLKYSRVGTRAKTFVTVDCSQVVAQVLHNLQVTMRETGANVVVEALPTIQADETQILQLFQNLVGNAIKFHSETAPEVRIWAERDGAAWRFGVADNGIGIEPQYEERVFVIFQRLHSREEYPGTGIGLAVCKKIVQRHGGRIWFESTPGVGATFFFTIPDQQEANK